MKITKYNLPHINHNYPLEPKIRKILKGNEVTTHTRYCAVDENGDVCIHNTKPRVSISSWQSEERSKCIGKIDLGDILWRACYFELEPTFPDVPYKLEYKLERNGRYVSFCIIEQDCRLTTRNDTILSFEFKDVVIKSQNQPYIHKSGLGLRGTNRLNDDTIDVIKFECVDSAQNYVNKLTYALDALKQVGFHKEVYMDYPNIGDVYWVYDEVTDTSRECIWEDLTIDWWLFKETELYKKEY